MTHPILKVENLGVALRDGSRREILKDVSFQVGQDEVLGIIGESGSGKTVLSRALVNWLPGAMSVSAGTILFRGEDLATLPAERMRALRGREIAYIGANPGVALDPTLPIGRQLTAKLMKVEPGLSHQAAKERVLSVLEAVRIPSHRRRFDDFPFQFSGGMLQRVMIVDALVTNPSFLVADNITQPLDVTVAAQILHLLRELQREFHTAIVFVSSALGILSEIADRVMVLGDGRAVETQPVRALIETPETDYTRELLNEIPRIWETGAPQPASEIALPPAEAKPAEREAPILSVRDVYRTYHITDRSKLFGTNAVQAVRGVSLDVYRGESIGIIGESGCGKSTLSRLLSQLETPDAGEIAFKGRDIASMNKAERLKLRREFQLLLQDPFTAIPPHWSIGRTISEALRIQGGLTGKEIHERVLATMAEVGLPAELHDRFPVGLSAGQRQRVNIARAMVLEPQLVILDETLSALDQVEQSKLLNLFERLQARHGMTYIYISHDLSMVRRACNRIAVMYLGRIVEFASNEATFFDPAHPYTRALLSAVPVIEDKPYDTDTYLLEGEPPDPVAVPDGCAFRSRCPFALEACATLDPHLLTARPFDEAACHLVNHALARNARPMPRIFA